MGECNIKCPSILDRKARHKWYAWQDRSHMSVVEAKTMYVSRVQELGFMEYLNHKQKYPVLGPEEIMTQKANAKYFC